MENSKISEEKGGGINQISRKSCVNFGLLNIRSIVSKPDLIYELIHDETLDFFILTETWHGCSENFSIKLAMPPGYTFVDFLRPLDSHHGGLIVFFRSQFKHTKVVLPPLSTFEAIVLQVNVHHTKIALLAIYRPGSAPVTPTFFKELVLVLEHVSSLESIVLVAGDFNIHIERQNESNTISLIEIFDLFHLHNRVTDPTHERGGILDLIISSSNLKFIYCKVYPSKIFSDPSH